jgi:acyl carrier protein
MADRFWKQLTHGKPLWFDGTLVNATLFEIPDYDAYPDVVPVGIVRKGVDVFLLNGDGIRCKPGEKGEMLVGGPGIAAGYYRDAGQTETRFISMLSPNTGPSGNYDNTYYRTGDLAVFDETGVFHFLGRNDDQVQLYGNRIEPAEIEAVIMSSQLVRQVAVIDAREGERHWLVAMVVKSENHRGITDVDIRNLVSDKLPACMIPQQVEFIEKLPMTHAGKTDRRALRVIYGGAPADDESAIPAIANKGTLDSGPCQETLQSVVDIWRKVLRVDDPGLDQDFFSLGGDSIQALEVLQQLRKSFKHAPKPLDLFRNRTIRALAIHLDMLNDARLNDTDKTFSGLSVEKLHSNISTLPGRFPLSNSQRGFYMLHKLQPTGSTNLVAAIPLRGLVDPVLLEEAIRYLIDRHPALRACFRQDGSDVIQEIAQDISLEKAYHVIAGSDWSELSLTGPDENAYNACFNQFRVTRLNLSEAPLFRIALIREGPDKHILLLGMHHIIGDAWSLQIITAELLRVYAQLCVGLAPDLPAMQLTFSDFVRAEAEAARHETPGREGQLKNYWMSVFSSLPPNGSMKSMRIGENQGDDVVMVIPLDDKNRLREICAVHGISLFQLLFAAYARALSEILAARKLLIQVSVSGRELPLPGIEHVVGCFARKHSGAHG